jgi:DICT domain-containing protein
MGKPYRIQRIGILNHVGGIWTPETFDSNEAAQAHIDRVQRRNPTWHLSKHKPAPVRVTLSIVKTKAERPQ